MSDNSVPEPAGWRILIKKHTAKTMTDGGIALPDDIVKGQSYVGYVGRVIAVGPEAYQHDKFGGDPWCAVGDWVLFNPHSGMDVKLRTHDGAIDTYRLLNDDEILGRVDGPDSVVRYDI